LSTYRVFYAVQEHNSSNNEKHDSTNVVNFIFEYLKGYELMINSTQVEKKKKKRQ